MAAKVEGKHPGEYVISEAKGRRSRDIITLIAGQNLTCGTILGKITASNKYTALAPAAGDGSQNAAAVLWQDTNATSGDVKCLATMRDTEANSSVLNWSGANGGQITAATTQLTALGIVIRTAV